MNPTGEDLLVCAGADEISGCTCPPPKRQKTGGPRGVIGWRKTTWIGDTTNPAARPDLSWHILSNGQHFCEDDISQLSSEAFSRVTWGIPIYAAAAPLHDEIVGKEGAYRQLREGLDVLLRSGAHVELRTVVLSSNFDHLPALAHHAGLHLGFCDQWSIMQLEAAGFAKNRFADLFVPTAGRFAPIGGAIDVAELYGLSDCCGFDGNCGRRAAPAGPGGKARRRDRAPWWPGHLRK